ncbi:MAG: hypothetical protein GY804_15345, partial [Alphaproteobacteria bacterium]|nr:hypothetical protein [Alphaproteobacteria bacterium]
MELVFDVEADNFYPAVEKTWVIVVKSVCGFVKEKIFPYRDPDSGKKFIKLFSDGDTIIGHNILGYDFFTLMKTMGINFDIGSQILEYKGERRALHVIDTLCLSRFISPDQHAHSLEWWGKKFNFPKIDFDDFHEFSHDMVVYCERDVDLNILVYNHLMKLFEKLYGERSTQAFDCYQYDYYLMCCQGLTGVLFDIDKAIRIRTNLSHDIEEIRARVEPQLPSRGLNKGEQKNYTMPKKPFKKDGSVAASTYNFVEKMINLGHECLLIERGDDYLIGLDGYMYDLVSQFTIPLQVPMTLSNQAQLKDWLVELGWKPTLWNYKKDSNGHPIRNDRGQLIQTTPKLQEAGKICDNLKLINIDLVKDTCKWLSLRNRNAVLTTWIANPRLNIDGRLSSRSSGTTPTYRHKHAEVVNVPKAQEGVLYGKEFRSLFCAPKGRKIVGGDASGLEARVDGHYCAKTDGGERADLILNGDIHSRNAKLFFPEETKDFDVEAEDFDKDHPDFKPYRSKSKNAAYALAY